MWWRAVRHKGMPFCSATILGPVAVGWVQSLAPDGKAKLKAETKAMQTACAGALVGAVIGDCLGAKFEGKNWGKTIEVARVCQHTDIGQTQAWIWETLGTQYKYTDDTAMTFCLGESIVKAGTVTPHDLMCRFQAEYESDRARGYGKGMQRLFAEVKHLMRNASDPGAVPLAEFEQLAEQQHNGQGSHGNGAAMRVSPVAVLAFESDDLLRTLSERSARVTHTHLEAVEGAVIQACAVGYILRAATVGSDFDADNLLLCLMNATTSNKYQEKLQTLRRLLAEFRDADFDRFAGMVVDLFGNGVKAEESVLAALAAFMFVAQRDGSWENSFKEVINLSIAMGGDTDTIASMAGAMAGARWGAIMIPQSWVAACEGAKRAQSLANDLLPKDSLGKVGKGNALQLTAFAECLERPVLCQEKVEETDALIVCKQLERDISLLRGALQARANAGIQTLQDLAQLQKDNEQLLKDNKRLLKDKEEAQSRMNQVWQQQRSSAVALNIQSESFNIRWVESSSKDGPWSELNMDRLEKKELTDAFWQCKRKPNNVSIKMSFGEATFNQDVIILNRQGRQHSYIKPLFYQNPRSRFRSYPLLSGEHFTISVKPRDFHQGTWEEEQLRFAESQFLRMLHQTQLLGNQRAIVTQVEIVCIQQAQEAFWGTVQSAYKQKHKFWIRWGFHGTDDAGMAGIKKEGFKVNHGQSGKNGQAFGKGIYLAVRPGLSMSSFVKTTSPQIILAQYVDLGNVNPHRQSSDGGAVVIPDEKQVYPRYIVHYKTVS